MEAGGKEKIDFPCNSEGSSTLWIAVARHSTPTGHRRLTPAGGLPILVKNTEAACDGAAAQRGVKRIHTGRYV